MQIFASDPSYFKCAISLCDKRLIKAILESSQLLSCGLYLQGMTPPEGLPCKPGWYRHPLAKWVVKDQKNFVWLKQHLLSLCIEYYYRFLKHHSWLPHVGIYNNYCSIQPDLTSDDFYNCTIFKNVGVDLCTLYKIHLLLKWTAPGKNPKWTRRGPPEWAFDPINQWTLNWISIKNPGIFPSTFGSVDDILKRMEVKLVKKETL